MVRNQKITPVRPVSLPSRVGHGWDVLSDELSLVFSDPRGPGGPEESEV